MLFVIALAAFLYLTVTSIVWRNVKLLQPWKAIFCLTIFPVFAIALVVNVWLSNRYLPWLIEEISRAQSGKGEALLGFLATTPLAWLIGYLWFLALRWLSQHSEGGSREHEGTASGGR